MKKKYRVITLGKPTVSQRVEEVPEFVAVFTRSSHRCFS
jgi:hypothetical protein